MTSKLEIIELAAFQTPPSRCSYIPAEMASLTYRVIPALTPRAYQELLSRGWRRFGLEFFRPSCPNCAKCRSLRVLVPEFQPTRTQRRVLRRNSSVRVIVRAPTITSDHLALYNAYHADMHDRRGWPLQMASDETYGRSFLDGGGGCAREFLYLDGDQLIGVGLVDVLPGAVSSVYFYHDPQLRSRALGVFSVLKEIEFARSRGFRHQYMGYWVPECQSMSYKSQYRPHEILHGYPGDSETPVWWKA